MCTLFNECADSRSSNRHLTPGYRLDSPVEEEEAQLMHLIYASNRNTLLDSHRVGLHPAVKISHRP